MRNIEMAELQQIGGGAWWVVVAELAILAFEIWEAAGHTHEVDQGIRDGAAAGQAAWQ